MKYSEDIRIEVLQQERIKLLKLEIKKLLKEYTDKELSMNTLSLNEQEDCKKLYATCISEINKRFYDFSVGDMISKLKENEGISTPNKNIVYIMNKEHLQYYSSILNKFYSKIKSGNVYNYTDFIAIANEIATRGKEYFIKQKEVLPIDDLIIILRKNKGIKRKKVK